MFNKKIRLISILLLIAIFAVSGCKANKPTDKTPPASNSGSTAPAQTKPAEASSTTNDKQDILNLIHQSQTNQEMSYTLMMTGAGISSESKVWFKGNRMKTDSRLNGTRSITLFDMDRGEVLAYLPTEKIATKIKLDEYQGQDNITPADYLQQLNQSDFQYVGTETVNGMDCKVITLTSGEVRYKEWISTKYGMVVKIEEDLNGDQLTIEFKDIQIGAIPDSTFTLPDDVKIMDLNAMMQNIPNTKTP